MNLELKSSRAKNIPTIEYFIKDETRRDEAFVAIDCIRSKYTQPHERKKHSRIIRHKLENF